MRVHRVVIEFSEATVAAWHAQTGDLAAADPPRTWSQHDLLAFLSWAQDHAPQAVDVVSGSYVYAARAAADRP